MRKFNSLIPELSVKSIEESKRFYIDILGFKLEYERPEDKFAFLSLGDIQVNLCLSRYTKKVGI